MKKKTPLDNYNFKKPVNGVDPITKGHFTIDWAFIRNYWDFDEEESKEHFGAVGQITIDGNDANPFYDALVKTPLLIQDHPLSVEFKDGIRFIKVTNVSNWLDEANRIVLSNVEFEFLDNLNYLENIQDFKNTNLL
jgi:hypothetical protein